MYMGSMQLFSQQTMVVYGINNGTFHSFSTNLSLAKVKHLSKSLYSITHPLPNPEYMPTHV